MLADPRARAFFDRLNARDPKGALSIALELLDNGTPLGEVLTRVVAPAQAEVGERWHRNDSSVADEHAATAVADAVVSALTAMAEAPVNGLDVVVVCAEGEWHLLAARITAETLRSEGCNVTLLGASMPAAHLGRFLREYGADVLAISCSTPLAFPGVLSFVDVAHASGIPALVGGRALGRDDRRARVLGADLWAPDALAAAELLRAPLPSAFSTATADVETAGEIEDVIDEVVDRAIAELGRRFPAMDEYNAEQLARTQEDVRYIVQFAQAAAFVRDPAVFDEFLEWLLVLLESRGVPAAALTVGLAAVEAVAAELAPALQALVARQRVVSLHV